MKTFGMTQEQLHSIPALRALTAQQLERMVPLFEPVDRAEGDVLFEPGEPADACYLLSEGELALFQDDEQTHRLLPPVLIGELGAVTGAAKRNTRAVVGQGAELWRVDAQALQTFLEQNADIAVSMLSNMLSAAADKIHRDDTRLADMRHNLISTQKSMKRMRDFLLESQETVVSRPIHEIIEGLIKQNRRVNYRVEPPPTLAAHMRTDDKRTCRIVQISRTHISYRLTKGELPQPASRVSGVLQLCGPEIPVSGKVLRTVDRRVDIELDLLIEEYATTLEGYLTRVQLLDSVV